MGATNPESSTVPASSAGFARPEGSTNPTDPASLRAHYSALPRGGGLDSACHMAIDGIELAGKRILDVGCRRGKGAYKLSDLAGPGGFVLGVDWRADFVEQAQAGTGAALARSGLPANNLAFRMAYPEALAAAGIEGGSFDVAYLNNSVTLLHDPVQALQECARALKPGGLLVLEVAVAEKPQFSAALKAARTAGDSVGAARTEEETRAWLLTAGFADPEAIERVEIEAAGAGGSAKETGGGDEANATPTPKPARFFLLTLQARKLP